MRNQLRKTLHLLLGVMLIILGIVGLVLPIINGTILLIIGLVILSFENPILEKKLHTLTQKNKIVHALYLKIDLFLRKFFGK
jgi:uncharacterized protein YqgC (DUF456 family)